jgi:hypothetical protein
MRVIGPTNVIGEVPRFVGTPSLVRLAAPPAGTVIDAVPLGVVTFTSPLATDAMTLPQVSVAVVPGTSSAVKPPQMLMTTDADPPTGTVTTTPSGAGASVTETDVGIVVKEPVNPRPSASVFDTVYVEVAVALSPDVSVADAVNCAEPGVFAGNADPTGTDPTQDATATLSLQV